MVAVIPRNRCVYAMRASLPRQACGGPLPSSRRGAITIRPSIHVSMYGILPTRSMQTSMLTHGQHAGHGEKA